MKALPAVELLTGTDLTISRAQRFPGNSLARAGGENTCLEARGNEPPPRSTATEPGRAQTENQAGFPLGIDNPHSSSVLAGRVLLVDDFEPWRRAIRSTLTAHGPLRIVGEAADGLEAVQKAQKLKPDLVLLDIGLPRLNGIEAARRVRKVLPETKILFLSQGNDVDVVMAVLSDGAQGYVVKAEVGRELLPAIGLVLRGEKFVSSRLPCQSASKTSSLSI